MKTRRNMVKRWIAGVLAVTMLSSTMSTAAFAAPESTDAPETVETTRVTAWNWTDGSALTWQEDTSAWTLTLSEEQTISAEADLLALLPVSVEATLAQAGNESTPAPDTAATPAPESTPDTEATEVTPTPVAEVDPAAEEGATAPAAAALAQPEEGAAGADTLSVEPQNIEEATPAPETATPAPTVAPQPAESPAPTEDAEPTEEPAATETLTLTWDTAALTYPLAGGDYTVTAALPEGYALDEAAPALAVVVKVPGAEEEDTPAADNFLSDSASAPSMMANDGDYVAGDSVQTVSPVGTTINLFDYWIDSEKEDQNFEAPSLFINWGKVVSSNDKDLNKGINYNHLLKFSKGGVKATWGLIDYWLTVDGNRAVGTNQEENGIPENEVKNANVYQGIVANTLAADGFPYLSDDVDESWIPRTKQVDDGKIYKNESLKYLFSTSDSDSTPNSRAIYANVKGLLKMENGYYTYDSNQEYARYNEEDNSFDVNSNSRYGFFPFNDANELKKAANGDILGNHYFGMTMTTRFVQQNGGHTTDGSNTPVTYEFTGDDDVWVFIDGVLVGDLGGIHSAASLKIDFSTGQVLINDGNPDSNQNLNTTIKQRFIDAKKDTDTTWSQDTFADNTYHTLQFFYLERGNNQSNLKLKFNMESTSESSIYNVDQNGIGIGGSKFELIPAQYNSDTKQYTILSGNTTLFTGTTDADGYLTLTDSAGNNLRLDSLKEQVGSAGGNAVVVRETNVPEGYRANEESVLYFPEGWKQDILLSADPWDQGTYASPMVTTTLLKASEIKVKENQQAPNVTPSTDSGTFFAVVMKKSGDQWLPVYGDPLGGWHVEADSSWTSVLEAANKSKYVFAADNSGPRVTIDNLPGDISKYYYIMAQNPSVGNAAAEAEYTVVYYYTSASGLENATADNTVQLNTDNATDDQIAREFSVQIYVSNVKNYVIVQSVGPDGQTPINGVTYSLYTENQVNADGTLKDDAVAYDTATTANMDQERGELITAEGAAVFPSANKTLDSDAVYYLKETAGPKGYELSDQLVKVIINDTGVYADAGTAEDDVTVLRGAGKIVRSMLQFAVPDAINTTLTDVTATLNVPTDTGVEPGNDVSIWKATEKTIKLSYHASDVPLEYGLSDGEGNPYFVVDSGWSRVTIAQNYNGGDLAYGDDSVQNAGPKENLEGKDLTNLFSRSTIVRVKNQPETYGLTISEAVSNPVGADTDKEFTVTVNLTKQDDSLIAGTLDYTKEKLPNVQDAAEVLENEKKGTWSADNNTLTLKHGQYITIQVPYDTKYTVTPTVETNYTTEIAEAAPLADGDPTRTETTGTMTADVTIGITNTRKAGSVAVSNTVEGAMGSYSDTFSYTLNLYDVTGTEDQPGKANISGTYTATITKEGNPSSTETVTITFDGNGQATQMMLAGESTAKAITLAHGDTLTIAGLPAGASFEAVETDDHKGYIVAVDPQKTGEDGASVDRTGLVTVPNAADVIPTPTIAFTNTREAIVPTGMREENNPYIVMIGLAGMAALVGAAGWVEMRRRKRREEE